MAYLGQVDRKASNIQVFNVASSTSATHNIGWTPPSEQTIIVTINGVKQHTNAYSFSGAVLTLSSALVTTDELEVIGINDIGNSLTPVDGSVTASKLGADSVITAKIQDNAVTLAKMAGLVRGKIIVGDASGDPSALTVGGASTVLTSDGTDAAWTAPAAGGITHASQWRMTADTSTGLDPIKLNWGAVNAATPWIAATASPDGTTALGAPMSVNTTTGRWTFPVTGYWDVEFVCVYDPDIYNNTASGGYIRFSDDGTDDSTFNAVTIEGNGITYAYYNTHSSLSVILDITNTTDCLVSFSLEPVGTTDWRGHSTKNETYVTFTRLGDT